MSLYCIYIQLKFYHNLKSVYDTHQHLARPPSSFANLWTKTCRQCCKRNGIMEIYYHSNCNSVVMDDPEFNCIHLSLGSLSFYFIEPVVLNAGCLCGSNYYDVAEQAE